MKGAHHEGLEHVKRVLGLVHGNHMSRVVYSQELEVLVLLELASGLAVDEPFSVGSRVELALARPLDSVGPGFATAPVADEILIARVNEYAESALKDTLDLNSEVVEPVT